MESTIKICQNIWNDIVSVILPAVVAVSIVNPYSWNKSIALITLIIYLIIYAILHINISLSDYIYNYPRWTNISTAVVISAFIIYYYNSNRQFIIVIVLAIIMYALFVINSKNITSRKKLSKINRYIISAIIPVIVTIIILQLVITMMAGNSDSNILKAIYIIMLRTFGLSAWSGNNIGEVKFFNAKGVSGFIASWDAFGLLMIISIILVVLIKGQRIIQYNKIIYSIILGTILQIILSLTMALLASSYDQPYLRWSFTGIIAPILISTIVIVTLYAQDRNSTNESFYKISAKYVYNISFIIICIILYIGIWIPKISGGKLLIDESHSQWERTDAPLDTTHYGGYTTYTYTSMSDLLRNLYNINILNDYSDGDKIPNADVYILKTPTTRYQQTFVDQIVDKIKDGAGLILIGDHTNVFGMNGYLNEILKNIKIFLEYDATYDAKTIGLSRYVRYSLFPNPLLTNFNSIDFATSCSIRGGNLSGKAVVGIGLRSIPFDYSTSSYFPDSPFNDSASNIGGFCQLYASKWGKGNIVVFTDSTIFSNFYMFFPGKVELLLSMVEYARTYTRKTALHYLLIISVIIAMIYLVYSIINNRGIMPNKKVKMAIIDASCIVIIAYMITCILVNSINRLIVKWPEPLKGEFNNIVLFEEQYGNQLMSPISLLTQDSDTDYQTFFVWSQRIGLFPVINRSYESYTPALLNMGKECGRVIINPSVIPSQKKLIEIEAYVQNGGKLLVLDHASRTKQSTANYFTMPFGVRMEYTVLNDSLFTVASLTDTFTCIGMGEVEGGLELGRSISNVPILVYQKWGKGMLIAGTISDAFTLNRMGGVTNPPTGRELNQFNLSYYLYRLLQLDHK